MDNILGFIKPELFILVNIIVKNYIDFVGLGLDRLGSATLSWTEKLVLC